jgi:GcrA cell cycle regulator
MTWTEERVGHLRRLFNEGYPDSSIARILGPGLSRNAVIGKRTRMGLSHSEESIRQVKSDNAKRQNKRRRSRPEVHAGTGEEDIAIEGDNLRDLPPDQSPDAVSLLKVKDNQCRWPLTDAGPGFLFCGSKLFDGPYCCRHYKLAHRG